MGWALLAVLLPVAIPVLLDALLHGQLARPGSPSQKALLAPRPQAPGWLVLMAMATTLAINLQGLLVLHRYRTTSEAFVDDISFEAARVGSDGLDGRPIVVVVNPLYPQIDWNDYTEYRWIVAARGLPSSWKLWPTQATSPSCWPTERPRPSPRR